MFVRDRTPAVRVANLVRQPGKLVISRSPAPLDWTGWEKARDLSYAQADLRDGLAAFEIARKAIGDANRLFAKDHHARLIISDYQRRSERRRAFVALNKARGRIARARKALAKLADA